MCRLFVYVGFLVLGVLGLGLGFICVEKLGGLMFFFIFVGFVFWSVLEFRGEWSLLGVFGFLFIMWCGCYLVFIIVLFLRVENFRVFC